MNKVTIHDKCVDSSKWLESIVLTNEKTLMTNQELFEAIALYYANDVKCLLREEGRATALVLSIQHLSKDEIVLQSDECDYYINTEDVNLILRPLSDLTKPCLEGGKIPMKELSKMLDMNIVEHCFIEQNPTLIVFTARYPCIKFMYKHHFDIHGLIEKGYAVDINSIEF